MLFWFLSMPPANAGNGRFSSKRESVGFVKRVVPSKPATPKNGFGISSSQKRAAAAQGHVTPRLELRRRLVVGVEADFQVIAAAARVGRFEVDAPRQLALDARGEVVHVRHDEVGVGEVRRAAEEGFRAQRAARAAAWIPLGQGFDSA